MGSTDTGHSPRMCPVCHKKPISGRQKTCSEACKKARQRKLAKGEEVDEPDTRTPEQRAEDSRLIERLVKAGGVPAIVMLPDEDWYLMQMEQGFDAPHVNGKFKLQWVEDEPAPEPLPDDATRCPPRFQVWRCARHKGQEWEFVMSTEDEDIAKRAARGMNAVLLVVDATRLREPVLSPIGRVIGSKAAAPLFLGRSVAGELEGEGPWADRPGSELEKARPALVVGL